MQGALETDTVDRMFTIVGVVWGVSNCLLKMAKQIPSVSRYRSPRAHDGQSYHCLISIRSLPSEERYPDKVGLGCTSLTLVIMFFLDAPRWPPRPTPPRLRQLSSPTNESVPLATIPPYNLP